MGLSPFRGEKAELKVKAGSNVEGSCERTATGSRGRGAVQEGNSEAAVSDNSFSESSKHMKSHSGTQTDTDTLGGGEVGGKVTASSPG